ncbi:MAG: HlyD family secretion protein [Acetatifactor sp.]|nr:HlyD family secretion protein [Acetatifactor sp.]
MSKSKKYAVIGFGIFLGFMAVCTVIAKGIYRSRLPKVTTQAPYSGSFSHEIKVDGVVKQEQEYGIFVESGLRVSTVVVRNGAYFEEGEPLFQVCIDDLQEIIDEKELEINQLRSIRKESVQTENDRKQKQQTAAARAREDYDNAAKEADARIEACTQALEAAKQELSLYEEYLEDFQADGNVSGEDVEGGDSTQQYNLQEKRLKLQQNVKSCNQELENAKRQKDTILQAASRAIEDAASEGSISSSAYESTDLEIAHKEKKLLKLKELKEAEGWVYSESAGRVIECRIAVGKRTQDEAGILYALDDGEKVIQAVFKGGIGLELNEELSLKANQEGGTRINTSVAVAYLEKLENGDTLAEMSGEGLDINIGQTVEVSCRWQTENYAACIPSLCIHDEEGADYVYVAEEREGILGTEWKVRKVFVTILDQTDMMTAVESAEISGDTKIVVTSTDDLMNGNVVRLVGDRAGS